jgi:hypothetical protein
VPPGRASLGFVPGQGPRHGPSVRFSCRASLKSTARLAGQGGPWPASAEEGEERTRVRLRGGAGHALDRKRPPPREVWRSPRSRGRRRRGRSIGALGRSCRLAAGQPEQATAANVAKEGGELPLWLLPRARRGRRGAAVAERERGRGRRRRRGARCSPRLTKARFHLVDAVTRQSRIRSRRIDRERERERGIEDGNWEVGNEPWD